MFACMRIPVLSLLLLALAGPAVAQQQQAKPQADVMDEVIVTAPRNGEPGFQESHEYHQKEYQRLHAMFGKPPPEQPRGDQVFASGGAMTSPNNRSAAREQVQSAPRLRDTFADD